MNTPTLFSKIKVGNITLRNRLVMAPMTRSRAGSGNVPTELMATYYGQRATAGLIITEATQIAPEGVGYSNTPGIHSPTQVEGWRRVTRAVHAQEGKIFLQLWHVGRISHSSFQPGGVLPIAPSAIKPAGQIFTPQGMQPYETPRALETKELDGILESYRQAAHNALAAGFDGVEIHGANGYLLDQFLRDGTNQRTDDYGGAIENRARLLLEATREAIEVLGHDRVGVRLSPSNTFNDMKDSNPLETFSYAVRQLNKMKVAYIHVVEASALDLKSGEKTVATEPLRALCHRAFMVNGGYTGERAQEAVASGKADLVAFGVPFLANPDLPKRLLEGAALNTADAKTFYGGDEKGYTDYPTVI
jgi:N-ethylmaleimide reductase